MGVETSPRKVLAPAKNPPVPVPEDKAVPARQPSRQPARQPQASPA